MKHNDSLVELKSALREFVEERDWQKFHAPKNLVMALSIETAELMEHFQWSSTGEALSFSKEKQIGIRHEIADVLIYLVRLSEVLDIDLVDAAWEKLEINRSRYPPNKVRGSSKKYSDY